MQIFALAVLIFGLAMVMDLHALFQDKKRKLGLLEDEGISNFADVASAKNQNLKSKITMMILVEFPEPEVLLVFIGRFVLCEKYLSVYMHFILIYTCMFSFSCR